MRISVSGYDNAGNKTRTERTYNVVDTTPPATVGNKSFTVTARDLANNQTVKTVNYKIV